MSQIALEPALSLKCGGMQPQVILNRLYNTQLQDTFGVIMLALVDNSQSTVAEI